MSAEDTSRDDSTTAIEGPLPAEELARHFSQRTDLTYRRISGLSVSGADVYQSLFTGALIRDCVFTKVLFNRSDLDGMRAENSTFVECDFTSCDIRSSIFTRCRFQSCVFDSTFIDDCEFQVCELTDCSFNGASLTACRFQESSLSACVISRATFLHNKLYGSAVSDMVLADCTLLYVILRDCSLTRVSISAESVGAIFGLTREQLSQAEILHLGEKETPPPDADIIMLLSEEYWRRKWFIGHLVLAVNFELTSAVNAFNSYLSVAYRRFSELGFVKGDELEFLGDLLQELALLDRLPLLTALNVLEWCTALENVIRQNNRDLPESSADSLRVLASRVTLLTNRLLDKLDRELQALEAGDVGGTLCVRATFREKPALSLPEVLNSVGAASTLDVGQNSYLVRSEGGSYVEIVFTTLGAVIALQVFLYLLNGCVIQLTELKHRFKVLARKNAPKTYTDIAISPTQQASPLILTVLNAVVGHVKGLPLLKDPSLSGYITTNIKSLEEVECEGAPDDTRHD